MKAKSILFSVVSLTVLWSFPSVNAISIDTQIEDELNKKAEQEMMQNAQDLNEKITFTKVNSCESMEKVMGDFLETYKKLHPKRTYRDSIWTLGSDWAVNSIETKSMSNNVDFAVRETSAAMADTQSLWSDGWVISDFSTTNIQKIWVDEPEILKSNGKYLFYYSEAEYNNRYISIIKAPTQSDLSDAEIAAKISIPDSLNDIQLFLNGDKLVILGTHYAN